MTAQNAQGPLSVAAPAAPGAGRIGVLLLNLGTPEATSYWPMRRYLKEFLSDRRVIEVPRLKWWPILNLIILTFRPGRKGKDYDKIWNRERDESPLKTITRSQSEKLATALGAEAVVDWAMRYGNPPTGAAIARLQAQGCEKLLLVPLYPQYAAATTASACDQAFRALMQLRWQPAVRVVPPYYAEASYIEALAQSLRQTMARLERKPEAVVISFHGMPQRNVDLGDPYYQHCQTTSKLLRAGLAWPQAEWHTTFQSRFGRDQWIEPATIETIERLAKAGVRRLVVIAPGFAADCLETLEELDMENRAVFLANGGESFTYVPCLNDGAAGMSVIEAIVRRELSGWI
ncbi:MAG TPA: ferrochelatase [Hyphomicrobiaceae bacterium]|nr:ferrochelatase [Hyphomicrobiaceae bacterium]